MSCPCVINFTLEESNINFNLEESEYGFKLGCAFIGGGGTSDYEKLSNKPQINSVTLLGNKTSEELGLEPTIVDITEQDIDNIIYS